MTTAEARYVLAHRELYDDATVLYALDVVETSDRQDRQRTLDDE